MSAMIRLEELTKRYPGQADVAVDNVTMEIPEGEIVVLVGPSGCGKTTTLKMINRLIEPSSGRIFLEDEDVTDVDADRLRRRIGYVIQQIGLFPHRTTAENIGTVPQLLGWPAERIRSRVAELMGLVGLPDELADRYPHQLSGGQRQRVGVARALAVDPPVMLMDEPFGAVDPINRERLQNEFLRLQAELGKTILFVTHDIDEAIKMGDRVAVFREGRLVQCSIPDDLLAAPKDAFVESFLGEDRALKRLNLVKVREIVSDDIGTVTPADTLETALARIDDFGYQVSILMVNDRGQPAGIVSRSVARTTKGYCRDHFQGVPAVIGLDDDLRKAASLMFAHDTTWLPCVDDAGRVCGQITQRAMTRHLGARFRPHQGEPRPPGAALEE